MRLTELDETPERSFLRRAAPYKGFALALLRIYLYDDKAVIALNYKDGTKTVNFNDMECALSQRASIPGSDLEILSPPKEKTKAKAFVFFVLFEQFEQVSKWSWQPKKVAKLDFEANYFEKGLSPKMRNDRSCHS